MSLENDQITAKNFKKFAESFAETINGVGIPDGGTTGQVLKKKSSTDYDVDWDDEEGGGVTDYEDLDNLPSINGTQLIGNKTSVDLDLQNIMQFSTMPTASASNEGDIAQYVGATTSTYTNGYFYECVEDSGSYYWEEKSVQEGGGVTDFDDLTNRPQESEQIDISELDLPMPAKPTDYPILFDETGTEYKVGYYKRASDGKVKPVYKKMVIMPSIGAGAQFGIEVLDSNCLIQNVNFLGAQYAGNWYSEYYSDSSDYLSILWIRDVNNSLSKLGPRAYTNAHFVLEYTKTSDEWKEV